MGLRLLGSQRDGAPCGDGRFLAQPTLGQDLCQSHMSPPVIGLGLDRLPGRLLGRIGIAYALQTAETAENPLLHSVPTPPRRSLCENTVATPTRLPPR